jgi:recombination protein RecA
MDKDILKRLKNAGLLSEELPELGFVGTGSYAINKVISGDFTKGIPIGMITCFHGEASSGKTIFATHILKEAQSKNYHAVMIDSENAYSLDFAAHLGIDPEALLYAKPETIEEAFETIEEVVLAIRETDEDTPIVVVYDSIAVSPTKDEYAASGYEQHNMRGAQRAKATGGCLRKINPMMRKEKVALVIINQLRSKVGSYIPQDVMAAGGRSLEYYLGVNLKSISGTEKKYQIYNERKQPIGIRGKIRNTKNKVAIPFKECEFELRYDEGLNPYAGVLELLKADGHVEVNGGWHTVVETGKKFRGDDFMKLLPTPEFTSIREMLQ